MRLWRARTAALALLAGVSGLPATVPAAAAPRPVDVYFLIDATTSQLARERALLVERIVAAVHAGRPDARFGYGTVTDVAKFSVTWKPGLEPDPLHVYQMQQRLVADPAATARGVASLFECVCGEDSDGQTIGVLGALGVPQRPHYSDTDQDAGWRPGALRVLVLITDSPFDRSDRSPSEPFPHPTTAESVAALRADGVRVVGIVVRGERNRYEQALDDVRGLAAGTGIAAASAYDIDRDRRVDLRRGAPFVVLWRPGSATSGLVGALADSIRAAAR